MSNPTQSLLPLPLPSEDKRPLPEIVADGNPVPGTGWPAFPLAYQDVGGKRYYAVQDWIRGVAQTENPRNFWNMLKRRLLKANIELSSWCVQLPYRAGNGKRYDIDHTDAEGLYRITQRMGVNTGLSERILNFLAASGAYVDGQRIDAIRPPQAAIDEPVADDPEKLIQAVINFYRRKGKTDSWIAVRMQSTVQRNRFTEAFQQALRISPSSFQFAEITDTMRLGLWKRDTRQLRKEMGLRPDANVRDHGSEIMLTYEMLAEQISGFNLRQNEDLEYDQAKRIVHTDSALVGRQAQKTSLHLGIDLPTGRPLLPAKTK
ncbi:MAG: hypothetical protein ACYDBJ_08030 [Aggregatilineales bacterium]